MIHWITKNLGTASFDEVSHLSDICIVDVRDLVDKGGNTVEAIRTKMDCAIACLKQDEKVVVCCDYGISRSNAIAAGLLSVYQEISFDQAVRQVIQATGEQEIKLEPLNAVRAALGEGKTNICGLHAILVTGGAGFIGRALLPLLEESYRTFAPPREEIDLTSGAAQLDLYVKKHGVSRLVHLANPRVYTSNRALGKTLAMLRNVLDVCRSNDIYLIYPSNWEIYSGYRSSELHANESLPPNPKGPYGETKWLCEILIDHYRRRHGLRCGLLRTSQLYGVTADRPKFIWSFMAKAREGSPIRTHEYMNGLPRLDLMHVSDFVKAIIAAINKGFDGDVNLGAGRLLSTRDIAVMIRDRLGSRSEIQSQMVMDYVANIVIDTSYAQEILPWVPLVTFEEGLDELISNGISL